MTVSLIIRPSRDVEEYVLWSMVSEAPEFVGDREQLVERLTAEFARLDCPNCRASRQYDLTRRVAWETRATPTLRLLWRIDSSGHVDGKTEMRDRAEGWSVSVRLRGDQSYLPRIALGLRLLAR